jgi:hypothetical protein
VPQLGPGQPAINPRRGGGRGNGWGVAAFGEPTMTPPKRERVGCWGSTLLPTPPRGEQGTGG